MLKKGSFDKHFGFTDSNGKLCVTRMAYDYEYLVDYHPYYGGKNPNFDENSQMLLDFKNGSPYATQRFLSLIERNYNPDWDGCYCVAVPSHDPANVNSPVNNLVKRLVFSHSQLLDGSELLLRTTKINKRSIGGTRNIDTLLNSIEVDNSKIDLRGKKVLLIDDVITTGNSVMACVAKLKDAGVKSVFVLALAFAAGKAPLIENIHVKRIQVKKLFGSINYDIDLLYTREHPVAILTAPNGRGKTTILNLLSFVLNPEFDTFQAISAIPFDEFRCTLTNDMIIELKHGNETDLKRHQNDSSEMLSGNGLKSNVFLLSIYNAKSGRCIREKIFRNTLENEYNDLISEEENIDDTSRLHFSRSIRSQYKTEFRKELQYLADMLSFTNCSIPVTFIKADRIQPVVVRSSDNLKDDFDVRQESPLNRANERIASLIQRATGEYSELVSEAKDALPQMFLYGEDSDVGYDEFMKEWSIYRKELDQFQNMGIITQTEDFTRGKDISSVYRSKDKGKFLRTYLSVFRDTTAPLKKIYERLTLFKQILDERNTITCKKVMVKSNGVSLFASDREIKLDMLSSGEKHDFIMFYNLIFNNIYGGLVLIDEPEISLHVEWQETYLDKLLDICKMNHLQAIVATHSPNIINSHYDLMVDKGESYESD